MSQLTLESLEKRVAALEQVIAQQLQFHSKFGRFKDWRQALGQFPTSELSEEIDAAGREIREADRRQVEL
jgi:hypothetical protein